MLGKKKIIVTIIVLVLFLLYNNHRTFSNEKFTNKYGIGTNHENYDTKKLDTFKTDANEIIIINEIEKLKEVNETKIPNTEITIKEFAKRKNIIDNKFVIRLLPFDLSGYEQPLGSKTDVCVLTAKQLITPNTQGGKKSEQEKIKENIKMKKYYRVLIINDNDTNETSLLNKLFGNYGYHQKKFYQFGISLIPYEKVCEIFIKHFYFDKKYFNEEFMPRLKRNESEIYNTNIELKEGQKYADKRKEIMKDKNYVFVDPSNELLALPCIRYFFTQVRNPLLLGYDEYVSDDLEGGNMTYKKLMNKFINYNKAENKIENLDYEINDIFFDLYNLKNTSKLKIPSDFKEEYLEYVTDEKEKETKKKELDKFINFKTNYPQVNIDVKRQQIIYTQNDADLEKTDDPSIKYVKGTDPRTPDKMNIENKEFNIIKNKKEILVQEGVKKENTVNMDNNNIRIFMLGRFFVTYNHTIYKDEDEE